MKEKYLGKHLEKLIRKTIFLERFASKLSLKRSQYHRFGHVCVSSLHLPSFSPNPFRDAALSRPVCGWCKSICISDDFPNRFYLKTSVPAHLPKHSFRILAFGTYLYMLQISFKISSKTFGNYDSPLAL